MASWSELEALAPDLAAAGRALFINCAPEWGIALLGTVRADGSPRIGPLCVYILDGRLYATVEGHKERDLVRDSHYYLHSYWGEGQDEFAVSGEAEAPADDHRREELITLSPRIRHSPVIRELSLAAAHSVIYRNFPRPDMYAEVIAWNAGGAVRRWVRQDGAPPEDGVATQPRGYEDLFRKNEYAHKLDKAKLEGLVVELTGLEHGHGTVRAICNSFEALKSYADFEADRSPAEEPDEEEKAPKRKRPRKESADDDIAEFDLALSYTINLVLPKTDDVAVFNAIFSSLRENLLRK